MHIYMYMYIYTSVFTPRIWFQDLLYTREWDRLKSLDVVGRYTPTSQYMILVAGGERVCVFMCTYIVIVCVCIRYITRWRSLHDLHTEGQRPKAV